MNELLHSFLEERRNRVFRYGRYDCVILAAEWLLVSRNRDIFAELGIARYRSLRQGRLALAKLGYSSPRQLADKLFQHSPALCGRVGDLAAVGEAMGIVCGSYVAVPRRLGWGAMPLPSAAVVYRTEGG